MENIENVDNYKKTMNYTKKNIIENFLNLLKLFVKNIVIEKNEKNEIIGKNRIFFLRGIKALLIIFMTIMKKTNNLELAYYHCEKAIYYYSEFFSQISNKNSFVFLTCNDALLFIYKRTIYRLVKFKIEQTAFSKQFFSELGTTLKIIVCMIHNNDISDIFNYVKIHNLHNKNQNELNNLFESFLLTCDYDLIQ